MSYHGLNRAPSASILPLLLASALAPSVEKAPLTFAPPPPKDDEAEMNAAIDEFVSLLLSGGPIEPVTENAVVDEADEDEKTCNCPEGFCAGKAFEAAFDVAVEAGFVPGTTAFDAELKANLEAVLPEGFDFELTGPNGTIKAGPLDPLDSVFASGSVDLPGATFEDVAEDAEADFFEEKRAVVQSLTDILGSISRMAEEVYGD